MIKILDNCCGPEYLDILKQVAIDSENWNLFYPGDYATDDKHLKLDIIRDGVRNPFLAGLALGLLTQIYAAGGQGWFIPEMYYCSISIKEKNKIDKIHVDFEKKDNFIKILGIINSDWKEEWGGGFFYNEMSNYVKPTSFCIFDPSELHSAEEIFTDKKRFAIDFAVFPDQLSSERMNGNQ